MIILRKIFPSNGVETFSFTKQFYDLKSPHLNNGGAKCLRCLKVHSLQVEGTFVKEANTSGKKKKRKKANREAGCVRFEKSRC